MYSFVSMVNRCKKKRFVVRSLKKRINFHISYILKVMRYFPVCLNINNKRCVVVGGGSVAERKAKSLLACGAKVTVISPALTDELRSLHESHSIEWLSREYKTLILMRPFLS